MGFRHARTPGEISDTNDACGALWDITRHRARPTSITNQAIRTIFIPMLGVSPSSAPPPQRQVLPHTLPPPPPAPPLIGQTRSSMAAMVARRITQKAFDATVQEKVDEFEMDREEAIADAKFRRFLLEVAQACDSHRLTVQGNTHRASIIHGKRRTAPCCIPLCFRCRAPTLPDLFGSTQRHGCHLVCSCRALSQRRVKESAILHHLRIPNLMLDDRKRRGSQSGVSQVRSLGSGAA